MSPIQRPPLPPPGWPARGLAQATDRKAIVALVLGIVSLVSCAPGVPAIVVGVIALRNIKRSHGTIGGGGMATIGIVTGGLGTLGGAAIVALWMFWTSFAGGPFGKPPVPLTPPLGPTAPMTATAVTTLSGREPGDAAYVEAARRIVTEGCCSRNYAKPAAEQCDHCAVLVDARIVRTSVVEGCANTCKTVTLYTNGPNGAAVCTVQVTSIDPAILGDGRCGAQ